jgi:hypothetical protein
VFELQSSLLQTLKRDALASNHTFQLTNPPGSKLPDGSVTSLEAFPTGLVSFARIWTLDASVMRKMGAQVIEQRVTQEVRISPAHELATAAFLQRELIAAIGAYGSTIGDDKALLAALPMADDATDATALDSDALLAAHIQRSAWHLRMGEKRILYVYSSLFTQYQQHLKPQVDAERKANANQQPKRTKRQKRTSTDQTTTTKAHAPTTNSHEEL